MLREASGSPREIRLHFDILPFGLRTWLLAAYCRLPTALLLDAYAFCFLRLHQRPVEIALLSLCFGSFHAAVKL